ncbi:type III secretion protein [Pseudomonas sp. Pseu.R1]|uniref:type III secretion protein n=1 Tax=Pseudomonas sp. Pseu.R1 TaxID=3379818 RepID=UPI003B9512E4
MDTVNARWIQWWCAPWQGAHPGWIEPLARACGWPAMGAEQLLRGRHAAFLSEVGITPSQPPEPVDGIVQWLSLSAGQQALALRLVASTCLGWPLQDEENTTHESWCRAIAKALRPGAWLDSGLSDPRGLLAAWAGEACWSRLRLSWAPDVLSASVIDLPANKLHTLWHAVLWRVTNA